MTRFAKLISDEGTESYINPDQVVALVPVTSGPRKGKTAVMLSGGNGNVFVDKTVPQLIALLTAQ